MSPGEVAALVASVALAIGVVGLLLGMGAMLRTMADVRRTVDDFRKSALPLLSDVHTTVRHADAELAKVDVILDRADSIAGTVDSASRLSYRVLATPLIKSMALATGTVKAYRAFRRKG